MASSSSFSPSAPAISFKSWKYHVFLSFRGEDTRKNFVDHLYSALEHQGIYTYKDDETLPRGESIGPSLMKAIEESQISVIIFSENYADSSWCLDELACIMKCKDTKGQTVMPIFYGVDPSEVRKQKRKYGKAFAKHELEINKKVKSWGQTILEDPWGWLSAPREQNQKYQEAFAKDELENKANVESWRKALADASNIAGWETKHIASGHESKVIKEIVDEISHRLQLVTSSANENLIGIVARMQGLKSDLQIGSSGVSMIGIWGVGGGGKTTLASSMYDEICRQFEGCCFIENVREESSRYGLGKLEEEILSKMGVKKAGGRCIIKDRLCHRKVLIVLDDVNHLDQLKVLAGSHDWFGEGSRIIITTRDKHILFAHKVNVIHNVRLLSNDEAIKLFCKHAPRDNRPVDYYKQLSKAVVSYAGGLPLALAVLGSFLCDKNIDEWKSALARLKLIPDTDILEKLKVSFDGLKPVEKELLLDIACFFRWHGTDSAMKSLDACGFHPVIGVKVLIQKALITVSDGKFDMHDLVQEMGHHIVRGKHPNNPDKYSRVWKREDVLKICAMDAKTDFDMIEAIRFEYKRDFSSQHLRPIIANTKNLRWIDWEGDLASPLLTNYPQRTLCSLILNNSLQKQLWVGYKLLPGLKRIELFSLDNLIMTPDFDGLRNLEIFVLYRCRSLEGIHPSTGRLERLVFFSVYDCPGLKMFPPLNGIKKLKTLSLKACHKLFKLSEFQHQNKDNSGHPDLDCSEKEVASYVEFSPNFFCICWRFFLEDLINLNLSYCGLGDEVMGSAIWELPNLKTLDLGFNDFSRLSFSRLRLPRLKRLNVTNCKGLVELSELPSSVAVVDADFCWYLKSFGDISNCKWLWKVSLLGKNKLDGDLLLDSILQGNAIEDYFINIIHTHQIPKGFVGRMFRGRTYTLRLPDDWYNDFCGFLICVVTRRIDPDINLVIKQKVDEDDLLRVWQESNKVLVPDYDGTTRTYVGYVSFSSLGHNTFLNSSYTMISSELDSISGNSFDAESYVGAELVPRKSKGHHPQKTKVATDSSEFWNEELGYSSLPFTIQHVSKSSIKISWQPWKSKPV